MYEVWLNSCAGTCNSLDDAIILAQSLGYGACVIDVTTQIAVYRNESL